MDNVPAINQATTQGTSLSSFVVSDGFVIAVAILFIIIMIMFTRRLNRLEESINNLNLRLDTLASRLVDMSSRPCQLESYGFDVEIRDPTGKKLSEIKSHTSN